MKVILFITEIWFHVFLFRWNERGANAIMCTGNDMMWWKKENKIFWATVRLSGGRFIEDKRKENKKTESLNSRVESKNHLMQESQSRVSRNTRFFVHAFARKPLATNCEQWAQLFLLFCIHNVNGARVRHRNQALRLPIHKACDSCSLYSCQIDMVCVCLRASATMRRCRCHCNRVHASSSGLECMRHRFVIERYDAISYAHNV